MCLRLLSYYNEKFGPDRSDRSVSVQPNQSIGPVRSVQALNSINRSRSGLNLRDNRSSSVGPSLLSLDRLDRTRTGPRLRLSIPVQDFTPDIVIPEHQVARMNARKICACSQMNRLTPGDISSSL